MIRELDKMQDILLSTWANILHDFFFACHDRHNTG